MDEILGGIFRIKERLGLLEHNAVLELPTSVSTKLPCETIDVLFVLKSMDGHMLWYV